MGLKLFYIFFSIVVLFILYLSWVSDPRLGLIGILPKWVTDWTDTEQNETIRTAIPFLLLGLLLGIYLHKRKSKKRYWFYAFVGLLLLVCLTELGQVFLPLRNCDVFDLLWGVFGAGSGLLIIYPFKYLLGK